MSPSQQAVDAAAARLAATTLYPAFNGGVYAFTDEELTAGAWFPVAGDHPLLSLAWLTVTVPRLGSGSFALIHARCRILIEDALAERQATSEPL
jgi:hypothetical protein